MDNIGKNNIMTKDTESGSILVPKWKLNMGMWMMYGFGMLMGFLIAKIIYG